MSKQGEDKEGWGEAILNWIGTKFQNPLWRDFIIGGAGPANTSAIDAAVRDGVRRTESETVVAREPAVEQQPSNGRDALIRRARQAAGLNPDAPLSRKTIRELQLAMGLDGSAADGLWGPKSAAAAAEFLRRARKKESSETDGGAPGFSLLDSISRILDPDDPRNYGSADDYIGHMARRRGSEAAAANEEMYTPGTLGLGLTNPSNLRGHDLDYYGTVFKGMPYKEQVEAVRKTFTDAYESATRHLKLKQGRLPFAAGLDEYPEKIPFEDSGYNSPIAWENDSTNTAFYRQMAKKPELAKDKTWQMGCINNATVVYGKGKRVGNNRSFLAYASKPDSGWQVFRNVTPGFSNEAGDIIQYVKKKGGQDWPHHSIMYGNHGNYIQTHADNVGPEDHTNDSPGSLAHLNNAVRVLGSRLGSTSLGKSLMEKLKAIGIIIPDHRQNVIRYVGTPQEKARWRKEWEDAHANN